MKPQAWIARLLIGAGVTAGAAAEAQDANCRERDALVALLAQRYGETRQAIGLSSATQMVEVFASDETGSWTITITRPDGIACMVAAGEHFEAVDEDLTPALLGDPA